MKPVASMGDACVDRYLPPIDRELVGGNALNVAVGLCGRGHDVAFAGAVGDDEAGARLLAAARARGISTAHVVRMHGPTGRTTIRVRADGDRQFESEVPGVCALFEPSAAALAELGRRAWVHAAGLRGAVEGFAGLRRGGTRLSYDFSHYSAPERIAELTPHLEVAFLSDGDADVDAASAMAGEAVARGARYAVVTRGRHGSIAACADGRRAQAAAPVAVMDTLGAGDAYIAACISTLVEGGRLELAMERGARAAAAACTHLGAWRETPALEASA